MAYAAFFMSGERFAHRTGPLTASLWTSASAGTALVIFTFATGAARMPNSSQWPLLVPLSVLTVGAFYCLFRGLRRLGSVKVSALGTGNRFPQRRWRSSSFTIVPGSASPSARH
jgi:drug/metabolite transporter (DMT)-like permease